MNSKKDPSEILTDFFNHATPDEIRELKALIQSRKQNKSLNNMNFSSMAEQVAASIKDQMGLSKDFVKETAETAIKQIIRAYAPDIPPKDLDALVKAMTPSMHKKYEAAVPPEMLKEMVSLFVDYSLGRMSEDEKQEMPTGWSQKYWFAFSPVIQGLINRFLHGEVDEELFWLAIDEAIRRSKTSG
ncbi:MAG: hypothetical protein JW904_09605 [Spirochaetales bacterium]|nr:hypothetical protein [Spirochaetales bacterium]